MDYKIAEVVNMRSHYYGEVVYVTEFIEVFMEYDEELETTKWYKAESYINDYGDLVLPEDSKLFNEILCEYDIANLLLKDVL